MRTIELTKEEALELRKELEGILKNYGINHFHIQDLLIKRAIMDFEIEDMPFKTRNDIVQKLFQNIKMSLRYEITKYKQGQEKNNDNDSIKEKIWEQINGAKKSLMFDNPKHQDMTYDYKGKRIVYSPKIDPRTDFGKGFYYKSKDGGEHATMEAVEQANKIYWANMTKHSPSENLIKYPEIEKAYFDIITPKMDINDKDLIEQISRGIIIQNIAEDFLSRYSYYLDKLLDQLGYDRQGNKKGPKR